MSTTIRDVAKKAGVSVSTVSAVINRTKFVSKELEQRVNAAISELNYEPSRLGRALSLKRTYTLGYLVPTIANPFFPNIVRVVEEQALSRGYGLFLCNTEGQQQRVERYRKLLASVQVDGLLITLTSELVNPPFYHDFIKQGIPVVGLAGKRTTPEIDCVVTDDDAGSRELTRFLLSLGHRSFGYLGVADSMGSQTRLTAMTAVLQENNIEMDRRFIKLGSGYTESDAYVLTRELLIQPDFPTVLVCYNDVMAVGAMRACNDMGLNVPNDISVTGYDDTLANFTFPRLTTMAAPTLEMGHLATRLLLARIDEKEAIPPRTHTFLPRLVVRSSTAPPKPRQ